MLYELDVFQLLEVYCNWQVIQRQLEEVEEKQRALEEKGVALEKILRGETGTAQSHIITSGTIFFKVPHYQSHCPYMSPVSTHSLCDGDMII